MVHTRCLGKPPPGWCRHSTLHHQSKPSDRVVYEWGLSTSPSWRRWRPRRAWSVDVQHDGVAAIGQRLVQPASQRLGRNLVDLAFDGEEAIFSTVFSTGRGASWAAMFDPKSTSHSQVQVENSRSVMVMILGAGPRQSMLKHALFTSLAQFGLHWPWRRLWAALRRQFDAVRWSPHRVACHQCDRFGGRVCSGPTSDHWGEAWVRPLVVTGFLGGSPP